MIPSQCWLSRRPATIPQNTASCGALCGPGIHVLVGHHCSAVTTNYGSSQATTTATARECDAQGLSRPRLQEPADGGACRVRRRRTQFIPVSRHTQGTRYPRVSSGQQLSGVLIDAHQRNPTAVSEKLHNAVRRATLRRRRRTKSRVCCWHEPAAHRVSQRYSPRAVHPLPPCVVTPARPPRLTRRTAASGRSQNLQARVTHMMAATITSLVLRRSYAGRCPCHRRLLRK